MNQAQECFIGGEGSFMLRQKTAVASSDVCGFSSSGEEKSIVRWIGAASAVLAAESQTGPLTFTYGRELSAMAGGLRMAYGGQEAQYVYWLYMFQKYLSFRTKCLGTIQQTPLPSGKINFRPITRTTAGQKIAQSLQRRAPKQQSSTS